ncbi:MAG TPA: LamG-like jellyroll fold domain-containing protein [Sunxiuqinia sp.]|nr:LamG-like jellyroll fold domain-containing protein [Sunxiuqinia sp.]
MKITIMVVVILLLGLGTVSSIAQTANTSGQVASSSDNLVAQPIPDRTVTYNVSDTGVSKPIIWGLDLAWLSEANIRRGIAFMGKDNVDVVRSSFMPTKPLVGDTALQGDALTNTNKRISIINTWLGSTTKVMLNCDHPSVDAYFLDNAPHWAKLIEVTAKMHEKAGRTVVSVSPFNEPDYGWGQYTGQNGKSDFYNICGELRKNPDFDNIRISGGNTLNCDQALSWFDYLKDRLDEGNTHQLAGSFDSFANFYKTVRANEDHATGDELHNVMEAMVGVEYGLQTGVWWGTAELARGEFVKASDGKRLGYAEDRPNWTAASVYRNPVGNVQAFGGTSERQAATTTYRFLSKDRDVFYDGHGPQREYTMVLPGGTGYQQGQTNAERVVNITWGDDIQPVINGRYKLVNRNSGMLMTAVGGNLVQYFAVKNSTAQQWNVSPVDSRIGGDFSYFSITSVQSGKAPDITNWSLDDGGNIQLWDDTKGGNQQWYLEYSGDGWFYIRSRHSAKCIEVANASTANSANIQQWEKDGGENQQWRLIPIDADVEFEAPSAPENLVASAQTASIRLDWTASPENDVAGYTIFRSESAGGSYNTIARDVTTTSFVDNSASSGGPYFYVVKAVDKSLNRSDYSNEVSASATGEHALVAHLQFDGNTLDSTINLNHGVSASGTSFVAGKVGTNAISLNGSDAFLQLPNSLTNHQAITIATWVYWKGGPPWQRIFDFGNGESENMFLTASTSVISGKLRFVIKNGGSEQQLNTGHLAIGAWTQVIVTLDGTEARMYVNGNLVDESSSFSISPMDFKPVLNYIGRSQYTSDPLFNGSVDDFRVYNYALSANEVAGLFNDQTTDVSEAVSFGNNRLSIWPVPANDVVYVNYSAWNNTALSKLGIFNLNGRMVMQKEIKSSFDTKLNVSGLPEGIYVFRLTNREGSITKRLIIRH